MKSWPCLKRLDLATPNFQSRQDRQGNCRLADTAMGARYDKSRNNHIVLLLGIVIQPQPHNDGSHGGTMDRNLFMLFIEDVVDSNIQMRDPSDH